MVFFLAEMNSPNQNREYVEEILHSCRLAVLATEAHGQPHASIIAITPVRSIWQLVFATYRTTRKFENILHNGRVAVLIQGEDFDSSGHNKGCAITAFGLAQEVAITEKDEAVHAHLERHPDLLNFLQAADATIIQIKIEKFQVVRGIDEIAWLKAND